MAAQDPDSDTGTRPAAPQVAGHFELLHEIGSGSSGTVYHARLTVPYADLPAGADVAVKFLRPELADDQKARARLFAEGELGRSLRHPNVAEIYGVETLRMLGSDTTYLVMQYVRGTTLRDLVRRSGPPVEDLTRRLGADAAKGLFALHRRGLAHRDVKPENLILTLDSELKIVDLGLASRFGSDGGGSSPGAHPGSAGGSGGRSSGFGLAGSVAYAAPETLRGRPAGPKSDLYALGIVLFEVTTGQHPFADATTADEMLDAHLHRSPPLPSHLRARVSPFLEQLLLDLLQKDPDDRPRSAAELARLLEQGERSDWWKRHEAQQPVLEAGRRLLRMRRPAEAAFVGRRDELDELDAMLAAARDGDGRVVAITGPEGIGRRRLCDEAMQRWLDRDDPPRYLGGEADSGLGHGEPFASALLDHLLRGDDRHSPNARHRAVEQARDQFGLDLAAAEALVAVGFGDSTEPSEVRADRLGSALLQLATAKRPLVLRVDHADDLDTSGRQVLQRLLAEAGHRHLLVLLAAGPDTNLLDPAGAPLQQRIDLAGLDERAFRSIGRSLFRDEARGERLDAFLGDAHAVLSGLPGSLLEMLDHLVQEGQLRGRVGDYHDLVDGVEPRPAPRYVERFRDRVRGFDAAHRRVLSAAAVLGDRCALADLSVLIDRSELAVLETLSLFRGRIVRAQGGEVSFRHRDFRGALLLQLPPEELQQLHLRAAELFEAQGARPLIVGMHRSQALDHEGCLDPLLAALQNRVHAGSRRTALRLVGRLAVHLRHVAETPANQRRRLRFLVLSAQAQQNADQNDAASRTFRDAERLARQLDDLEASAASRVGLATGELDQGRLLSAIALLETVHDDLAFAAGDPRSTPALDALAAQAHALHGRILLYLGQAGDSLKHLQAAKKRVPAEQEDLRCHLWIDLARTEALSHRYATALRTLREIEKLPPVRQQPRARLRFHLYRGFVRGLCGDEQAHQDLRLALDEALRLALPVYGSRAAVFLGELYFLRGRDDDARLRYSQAVQLAQAAGDRLGGAVARAQLVRLGAADDGLAELVLELDLPEVHASWWLAQAMTAPERAPADLAERFEEVLANVDLPLPLHLRVLAWLERPASARSLVRSIAERFPERSIRQRFRAMWQRGARA
ncbi:MAG: serine/threonine-protein kinase PknK [Planctomycetes bacterium]|nr:serine/threonine-protein kinase PknK [Planctomycetota bacterium]